jgi:hypothetical protein
VEKSQNPSALGFRHSGIGRTRVLHLVKSRVTIHRIKSEPLTREETAGNIPEFEGGRSKSARAIRVRGSGLCGVKGS